MRFDEEDCDPDIEVRDDGSTARCSVDQWRGVRVRFEVTDGEVGICNILISSFQKKMKAIIIDYVAAYRHLRHS